MTYFKIKDGRTNVKCNVYEMYNYVERATGDVCPPGFKPRVKVNEEPVVPPGKWLAFQFVEKPDCIEKSYFLVDAGQSAFEKPRTFSKLKLYAALSNANLWDALKTWLESQTYEGMNAWTAFSLAQDLSKDHPMFAKWFEAAKEALGVDDSTADAILAAAVID